MVYAPPDLDSGLRDALAAVQWPGDVLFAKVWGSHSHNTALPTSDVDYLMIYASRTAAVLSLTPPPETIDGTKPDYQAHEVGKLCHLLIKGNPGIVEMLFTDRMYVGSPEWDALKEIAPTFINQQTLKQYLGYGNGQLHRLLNGSRLHTAKGEYNTKWAYHLIRLAHDAGRIARGIPPVVWKEGGELEELMAIRMGEYTPSQIETRFRQLESEIDALKPWGIPETADKDALNDWLLSVRAARFSLAPPAC